LLHPAGLANLGVQTDRCAAACQQLLERGFIIRSGNNSGTVQERVVRDDGRVKKMRFWVLNVDKLREAESKLRDRDV
jgi:hypothetical protein